MSRNRGKMYRRDRKVEPGDYKKVLDLLEGGIFELKLQRDLLDHVNLTTGENEYFVLSQAVAGMIDEVDLFEGRFNELLSEVFVRPSEDAS